jgi:hypothetical protein
VFPRLLFADPLWLRKTATGPHIFAHVNIGCPDDRYPKLNICILGLILDSYEYIHASSIPNNSLHDLNLTKLIVARFVGAGGFS